MSKPIHVIKRNGEKELLSIEKIQTQIQRACDGITDVSPSMIELSAKIQFHDGMTTETIDKLLLRAMLDLIDIVENPDIANTNYQFVAGKQRLRMLRKDVYNSYDVPRLYDIIIKNIKTGLYTKDLLDWYSEEEWDQIEKFVDHSKDEKYSFAAIEQLIEKYLIQNRSTKTVYETPQIRYIIAAATIMNAEKENRLEKIKDYYKASSNGNFSVATPLLSGLGTNTKQFSSCVLISVGDNKKSIFAAGQMMAEYGAERAGIGLEVGKIRGLGSEVKKGEKSHTGIVPFMQKWYRDLRSFSQGGIRNSSMTAYMPIWHINFDDFIVLKNNQGTVETRVRHVDYGIVLSAFFWRRYKEDKDITFFDPNQVPDLYKAFYDDIEEFERLYLKYEKDKSLTKKTTKAKYVFNNQILKERSDTGRVYLVFIDNVINSTPFDVKTHPIVQSNLCVEILLPTIPFDTIEDDNGRISLCTLGSINLGVYKNPEDMEKSAKLLVRSLSNVLAYQDFLSIQAKLSNEEFEPLGIGITNLAYWMAKRGYKYGEPEALKELKRWMEYLSYYILETSVELAEERGPCKLSHTTDYAKGIFTWEKRSNGVNDLVDFTSELDWEPLRARMIKSGVKNAVQMAVAPVESSSIAMPGNGSTNGIEMPMALISVKESKAGSFIHVVPEYQRLKNKYQLMWEQTDCIDYIKTAAVINAYIDQSISTNTFYSPRHFDEGKIPLTLVAKNLMLAHKWGIKTFYYSLIEKLGKKDSDSSEDIEIDDMEQVEESCSSCVL